MYNKSLHYLFIVLAFPLITLPSCTESKGNQEAISIEKIPVNMVFVKGGKLHTVVPYTETPVVEDVHSFYIDKSPVTVGEFRKFAIEKKFKTDAEKFGNSPVFDIKQQGWAMADSVSYLYPLGKRAGYIAPNDHPVTQVSWQDAEYYCECQGKRLPSDSEWEWAAKSGQENYSNVYPWGNEMVEGRKFKANYWQGEFPYTNTQQDGFLYTSPVGHFGSNPLGLTDMGGNVWQWCADDIAPTLAEAAEDTAMRKVLRGGSYLCDPAVCHGFKVEGRSASTPETGLPHVGFRCVKDAKSK